MIAPIKKTQTKSGSSSQMSAEPPRVCAARPGADAGFLCVAEGDGALGVVDAEGDGALGVVDDEVGVDAVGVGVVAVGVSGNC
jgi:hypothetical protein